MFLKYHLLSHWENLLQFSLRNYVWFDGYSINFSFLNWLTFCYCLLLEIIFSYPWDLVDGHSMKPFWNMKLNCFSSSPCHFFSCNILVVHLCVSVLKLLFYELKSCWIRWQEWEGNFCFGFLLWFANISSSFFSLKVNWPL